jgi:hypothetical protein
LLVSIENLSGINFSGSCHTAGSRADRNGATSMLHPLGIIFPFTYRKKIKAENQVWDSEEFN